MNKKVSNQFKKIIITASMIVILLSATFAATSCKSDFQEASEVTKESITDKPFISTTAATDSNTVSETPTSENGSESTLTTETTTETTTPNSQQIIEITAGRGGYSPKKIEAKAGIPTILIMKSIESYGCERTFNIPDLNIGEILPENGQTKFDLGVQEKNTKLLGVCSMGMYYFQIFFN